MLLASTAAPLFKALGALWHDHCTCRAGPSCVDLNTTGGGLHHTDCGMQHHRSPLPCPAKLRPDPSAGTHRGGLDDVATDLCGHSLRRAGLRLLRLLLPALRRLLLLRQALGNDVARQQCQDEAILRGR